jgi:hypothetical protein
MRHWRARRAALTRDDDYASVGKPPCDWDDPTARDALVDALVCDAQAALAVVDGQELAGPLGEAGELLGLVAGQDVETGEDGIFRIARRVARDRLISTVDVQARHGHGVFKGSLQHCWVIRSSVDHAGARLGCPSRAFCVGGR